MKKYLIIALTVVFTVAAQAGDGKKEEFHFTGNPSVDLFSPINQPPPQVKTGLLADNAFDWQGESGSSDGGGRKSPWLAALFSAAVPGAGELYTGYYLKAGVFAGVEVLSWLEYFHYNSKGDNQTLFFEAYANQHYSVVQYLRWTYDNAGVLSEGQVDPANYYAGADTLHLTKPPFDNVSWVKLHNLEDAIEAGGANNGYTHEFPYYNQQQYYELIGKYDQFSAGWDDANLNAITSSDLPIGSRSAGEQQYYANLRADANHYYDIAITYESVAVINHILSALDAYWSATRYNAALHAELKVNVIPTSYGLAPQPTANFRYDF
ncbi:MAG TPA: hypothetical protein VKS81_01370 [Bacteroidota bacterium]|nr:hypothetical protein [Bacteroidota bacterium]